MTTKPDQPLSPPEVGLGTFPFSSVFREVTHESAERVVTRFHEQGGRFIETAPVYPDAGVDLGRILSELPRDEVFIATKCVTGADASGEKVRSGARDRVRRQVEEEQARLRVETLDLLQSHIVPGDVSIEELGETLQELKEEGAVTFAGISNVSIGQLKQFAKTLDIDFVQNRYSVLHRGSVDPIIEYCASNGIWLNSYQVIERGLFGSIDPSIWREGDLRRGKHEYRGEVLDRSLKWVSEHFSPIAVELGISPQALAIAWVLSQRGEHIAVVGATTEAQVDENVSASRLALLDEGVIAAIDEAYELLKTEVRAELGLTIDEYRGVG